MKSALSHCAAALLVLLATSTSAERARAQAPQDQQVIGRAMIQLGAHLQRGYRRAVLMSGEPYFQLYGPIYGGGGGAPLCYVQILELAQDPMGHEVRGMSLRRVFRLLVENDGTPWEPRNVVASCATQSVEGHWYSLVDWPDAPPQATGEAVWIASGILHTLRQGRRTYDNVDLNRLLADVPAAQILRASARNARQITSIQRRACAPQGRCHDWELAFDCGQLVMTMRTLTEYAGATASTRVMALGFQEQPCPVY